MKLACSARPLINRFSISLLLALFVLPVACSWSGNATPTATSPPVPTPTGQSEQIDASTTATAVRTSLTWLESLKLPGPGLALPDQFFFLNGSDLWLTASNGTAQAVLSEKRVGPHADVPDGSRTAVVLTINIGSRAAEEIRLIDQDGNTSEPIYGPVFLEGPGSKSPIHTLVWDSSGQRLALLRHDGSVSGVQVSGETPSVESYPLVEPGFLSEVRSFAWSPNGDGAVLLSTDDAKIGHLHVIPDDGSDRVEIAPDGIISRSIGAVDWIPEQGRLIFTEDNGARINPNAGTLFSMNPDGTDRVLLVSSGEFGPAVTVPILHTSPDGDWVAFAVYVPGTNGIGTFDSLWIFEFATSVLIPIPVSDGFRVTDIWWTSNGLAWRGTDVNAPAGRQAWEYEGYEPFTLGIYDIETGQSSKIANSAGS